MRRDSGRMVCVVCALPALLLIVSGCGGGGTRATVRFSQWIEPQRPFPPDIKSVAVVAAGDWLKPHPNAGRTTVHANLAIIVGHAWADHERFDVSGPGADLVMKRLQAEIDRRSLPIRLVDRETFDDQLRERELAISDLVNPEGVVTLPGMAPVDGLIVVKSTATSNVERVPVDTLTLNDISRAIQSDGNYVRTSQRMSVQRQITLNTSIRLTNAMTGVVQATYSTPKSQTDKARPGFLVGDNMAEANLPPGAEVVQQLLETQAEEFVGAIVGVEASGRPVTIRASGNADCQAGVRYLESESWSMALDAFRRAINANSQDHQALYGAGVACEKLGRYDDALRYFEKAVGLNGSSTYTDAVRRVRKKLETAGG